MDAEKNFSLLEMMVQILKNGFVMMIISVIKPDKLKITGEAQDDGKAGAFDKFQKIPKRG